MKHLLMISICTFGSVSALFESTLCAAEGDGWVKNAVPVLKEHCLDCHRGESAEAGLDLEQLARLPDPAVSDVSSFEKWVKVHDRVQAGEMPPKGAKQLGSSERRSLIASLEKELHAVSVAVQSQQGRVQLRRLNRAEYEYTLRDLLAIPNLEVASMLPADAQSDGFDTVGSALNLSYIQMDRYLKAATLALEQAMVLGPKPLEEDFRLEAMTNGRLAQVVRRGREAVAIGDAVGLLRQPNSAQAPWWWSKFQPRSAGIYRFRMKSFGFVWDRGDVLPPDRPHVVSFLAVQQSTKRPLGTFDVVGTPENPAVIEFDAYLTRGDELQFWIETLSDRSKPERIDINNYTSPGMAVEWLDVKGPIHQQWPPASYQRLFGELPSVAWTLQSRLKQPPFPMITVGVGKRAKQMQSRAKQFTLHHVDSRDRVADAERLLRDFMERAYRRPIQDDELNVFLRLVTEKLQAAETFQESMKIGYQAVLCSPDFLFMQSSPGRLNDHALATRLACFLWKSLPDDSLLASAEAGRLTGTDELRRHVERMLDDPKSARFVEDFTGQWLDLRRITVTQPDEELYPEYDGMLLDSMVNETHAWFSEMLRRDLSVSHLVDSDFAMLNSRLAKHYGIDGIDGMQIRRVELPDDSSRGGLLTQASVLKVTANGTTTSPVIRGAWIMDRILGKALPPPPPNIPAVEPDLRGTTTIREQLAKHSNDTSCAVCHQHIDPPGFALENFDVIGGWRDRYRSLGEGDFVDEQTPRGRPVVYKTGLPVDASGDGFDDIHGYRRILLQQKRQIARNLISRLIIYSTGAGIQFADRRVIDNILNNSEASGYGLRTLIHEVVSSEIFRNK